MRRESKDCRGAFLLEALLAVFIVSVALVALIRGLLTSLNAAVEAEKYADAITVADNSLLEMVRLNGQIVVAPVIVEQQSQGTVSKVEIKVLGNSALSPVLQQAQLIVAWPGPAQEKTIEATTLIFGSVNDTK